jgi:hypothetical protein
MRLVTVTPAGRRPYLEILANYLLRHRDVISEHRWWLNTRIPEDVAYIYRLTDRYPDFFRIEAKPVAAADRVGYAIWQYMIECVEADTVYLRLDDDICYIADGAIRAMYDFRVKHPEPFLVLGNIVNNAVCGHFQQKAGLLSCGWGQVAINCLDPLGWGSGPFARRVHRRFLKDLGQQREEWWRRVEFDFDGLSRFSINAICWCGKDFEGIADLAGQSVDEEPTLTEVLPRMLGRPNVICQRALFGHYAFYTQRPYLERTSPDILTRYRRLAESAAGETASLPRMQTSVLAMRRYWGLSKWALDNGAAKTRQALKSGKNALRRKAA